MAFYVIFNNKVNSILDHLFFSENAFEPSNRIFGNSCQVILVIHVVESKPHTIAQVPFPVVKQSPHEITTYIALVFPAFVDGINL